MFHKIMGVSPSTYKLFLTHSHNITDDEVFIIQDHLSELDSIFKRIDDYRKNIPPKDTVKALSIFK